ncbi:MAG: endonuclease I [Candidatus Accumulibacter sp.]|uniref:endonuclease I n=1 Tax=Accumulibacter sp. TaxID=2053492 RepID=UPI002582A48B|nr:endonuclease I [Accumulibacter sp.]MBK8117428.1 endonuclease I [Accumulibacter sp.]
MTTKRRSKLEENFEYLLNDLEVKYKYEDTKLTYIVPESKHTYLIDWSLPNNIYVETKGYLSDHKERSKYILIKEQYPNLDLRFVFMDCNKLCGGAKYSHGTWATKQGFKYCSIKDYEIIKEWLNETSCDS